MPYITQLVFGYKLIADNTNILLTTKHQSIFNIGSR